MARTPVVPTIVDRTGTVVSPAAVAMDVSLFNSVANDGRVFIKVTNTGGTTHTLTVPLPASQLPDQTPGAAISFTGTGVVYSLATTVSVVIGPFPPQIYNQADGTVWLTASDVSLTILAYHL